MHGGHGVLASCSHANRSAVTQGGHRKLLKEIVIGAMHAKLPAKKPDWRHPENLDVNVTDSCVSKG